MKLEEIPVDPDCGGRHLGHCGGQTFRQRMLSVRISAEATPTRTARSYYDEDLVTHQFGGKDRKQRKEEYLDATQGFGAAETQPDGSIWATDPKTKERRELTLDEVNKVYLTGGTGE